MSTNYFVSFRRLAFVLIFANAVFYTACTRSIPNKDITKTNEELPVGARHEAISWDYVIDQSNTALLRPFSRNNEPGPLGQEFTPTLYALDAVELQYDDASCCICGGNGGDLKVVVREGSINGPIIGTSNTFHYTECFFQVTRFDFPAFIPV